jgi:hypothetical protein
MTSPPTAYPKYKTNETPRFHLSARPQPTSARTPSSIAPENAGPQHHDPSEFPVDLASGNSINERGEIRGTDLVNDYFTHAFLLTPVDEDLDVNQSQKTKDRCRDDQKRSQ